MRPTPWTNCCSQMLLLLASVLLQIFTVSCDEDPEPTTPNYFSLDYSNYEEIAYDLDGWLYEENHNSGSFLHPGYFSIIVFLLYLSYFSWSQHFQVPRRDDPRRREQE